MDPSRLHEQITFWRDPAFNNLELLRATYITHSFAPHIHEGYAIGVIDKGAEHFMYRRSNHVAPQGNIVVIQPGEMHTGSAATAYGWTYRMLYPESSLLQRAASEMAGRERGIPFFPSPVIDDPALATLLSHLHATLEHSPSTLERESQLLWTFAQLILRHAENRPILRHAPTERISVQKARAYLEDHYAENISLEELAAFVNLSLFHLLRVFRDAVGLPPHNYLTQVRITRAKQLLLTSMSLAQVALTVGFTDQSHLTKHFKRIMGVTPGQYAHSRHFFPF
jgi:AraC-like DNA-binding protein